MDKVYTTSDGNVFLRKNAANLHKTSSGKKLILSEVERTEKPSEEETKKVKKLSQMNLTQLQAAATQRGIQFEKETKKELKAMIEKVDEAKVNGDTDPGTGAQGDQDPGTGAQGDQDPGTGAQGDQDPGTGTGENNNSK